MGRLCFIFGFTASAGGHRTFGAGWKPASNSHHTWNRRTGISNRWLIDRFKVEHAIEREN
jgi:hypothetical protein